MVIRPALLSSIREIPVFPVLFGHWDVKGKGCTEGVVKRNVWEERNSSL